MSHSTFVKSLHSLGCRMTKNVPLNNKTYILDIGILDFLKLGNIEFFFSWTISLQWMRQCQQILIFFEVMKNVIFCIVVLKKTTNTNKHLTWYYKEKKKYGNVQNIIALSTLINLCTSEIGHDSRILMCSCALLSWLCVSIHYSKRICCLHFHLRSTNNVDLVRCML